MAWFGGVLFVGVLEMVTGEAYISNVDEVHGAEHTLFASNLLRAELLHF